MRIVTYEKCAELGVAILISYGIRLALGNSFVVAVAYFFVGLYMYTRLLPNRSPIAWGAQENALGT